jgi:hypothetical protein
MSFILLHTTKLSIEIQDLLKTYGIIDIDSARAFLDRLQQGDNSVLTKYQTEEVQKMLTLFPRQYNANENSLTIPPMGVITEINQVNGNSENEDSGKLYIEIIINDKGGE